ncbi:uncharacterized protein LOC122508650 [Leptopilina heterotoma]|uniref:uncharacterized protein LOC122508650 n=1 Tax=Leptopilina heterotoma TaxID=63436 RepID=UPI001CA82466|nr:uncharacterized protein LOC122508650 [Leptopilina heterotoma]
MVTRISLGYCIITFLLLSISINVECTGKPKKDGSQSDSESSFSLGSDFENAGINIHEDLGSDFDAIVDDFQAGKLEDTENGIEPISDDDPTSNVIGKGKKPKGKKIEIPQVGDQVAPDVSVRRSRRLHKKADMPHPNYLRSDSSEVSDGPSTSHQAEIRKITRFLKSSKEDRRKSTDLSAKISDISDIESLHELRDDNENEFPLIGKEPKSVKSRTKYAPETEPISDDDPTSNVLGKGKKSKGKKIGIPYVGDQGDSSVASSDSENVSPDVSVRRSRRLHKKADMPHPNYRRSDSSDLSDGPSTSHQAKRRRIMRILKSSNEDKRKSSEEGDNAKGKELRRGKTKIVPDLSAKISDISDIESLHELLDDNEEDARVSEPEKGMFS